MRGQWSEVVVDQLAAGGITVGIRDRPAGRFEQLPCPVVDDVPPRREERDMAPLGDRRARRGASLEHDERLVAQRELGGGGEADRAGADDRHGKGFQVDVGVLMALFLVDGTMIGHQARIFWRDFAAAGVGVTPLQQFSCR